MSHATRRLSDTSVSHQSILDKASFEILNEAQARFGDFLGGQRISVSRLLRHSVLDLLSEELRVLDDLGDPDKAVLRQQLADAGACRPAVRSHEDPAKKGKV